MKATELMPYSGRNTRYEPNIVYTLKLHRAILMQWFLARKSNVECAEESCKKESKYSIFVIDNALKRQFHGTTCCEDHLEKAKKFFADKKITISEIIS